MSLLPPEGAVMWGWEVVVRFTGDTPWVLLFPTFFFFFDPLRSFCFYCGKYKHLNIRPLVYDNSYCFVKVILSFLSSHHKKKTKQNCIFSSKHLSCIYYISDPILNSLSTLAHLIQLLNEWGTNIISTNLMRKMNTGSLTICPRSYNYYVLELEFIIAFYYLAYHLC